MDGTMYQELRIPLGAFLQVDLLLARRVAGEVGLLACLGLRIAASGGEGGAEGGGGAGDLERGASGECGHRCCLDLNRGGAEGRVVGVNGPSLELGRRELQQAEDAPCGLRCRTRAADGREHPLAL